MSGGYRLLMRSVGLDLSLTSTGFALAQDGPLKVGRYRSTGKSDDDLSARQDRLQRLAGAVVGTVKAQEPDIVCVEGPSYASKGGHNHDRAGYWWLVVFPLVQAGLRVVEIPPTVVKKYATGLGNAGKDEVLAAVVRRYPSVEVANNDEADALVLACIGARLMGVPVEDGLPARNLEVMKKLPSF